MSFKIPDVPTDVRGGLALSEKETVAISLEFWHANSQCLSDWNAAELKKLRKAIDKVQSLTPSGVRNDTGLQFKLHKGAPKGSGFSRPNSMPKDYNLCELRLSDKARLHGCLTGSKFFLVWLDKNHAVFPSGK